MNPLSSKAHSLAQTRQTKHRTNRTENQHEQSDKADFGAQVSRMRRRYSALSARYGETKIMLRLRHQPLTDLHCQL